MKKMPKLSKIASIFWLCWILFPGPGYTQVKPLYTYYNIFYGARSLGLGNAFTAVADDLTAVYRNPAGIGEFTGPQFYLNYRSDKLQYHYDPQESVSGTAPTTTRTYTYDFSATLKNVDFVSVSVPVSFWYLDWNFALSYYRYFPYGIEGQLREELVTGNTAADAITTLDLSGSGGIDVVGFTSALYLKDYFSVGITLQKFLNTGKRTYTYTSPTVSYTQAFSEKINEWNLVLGLLGKLTKDIIVGLSYQTRFTADWDTRYTRQEAGISTTVVSVGTKVVIPAQLAVGLLLKPYPFMRTSFEYSIFYWADDPRLSNYYGMTRDLEFPVRNDFTFTQVNTENYRMGVEFNVPLERATVFLRGGLFRDRQLFTDGETPPAPVKFNGYSLGLGIDISSMAKLDIAYMRQKGTWNEAGYFNPAVGVRTQYKNDIFCISFSFSFGGKGQQY